MKCKIEEENERLKVKIKNMEDERAELKNKIKEMIADLRENKKGA